MNKSRQRALEQLLQNAEIMIQGSLSQTMRTCGNPNCHCHRGEKHGPHTYLTFRKDEGRSSGLYVPKEELSKFQKGIAAWKRFRELTARLAWENREQIVRDRRSWKSRRGSNAGKA